MQGWLARARRLQEQATTTSQGETGVASGYPAGLTAREVEVLRLLASGRSNKEIAQALVVSVPTAERHVANVYAKIGARGRVEATMFALHNGLAPAPAARGEPPPTRG